MANCLKQLQSKFNKFKKRLPELDSYSPTLTTTEKEEEEKRKDNQYKLNEGMAITIDLILDWVQ